MRVPWFSTAIQVIAVTLLASLGARADLLPSEGPAKALPDRIGDFRAVDPVKPMEIRFWDAIAAGARTYRSAQGESLSVMLLQTKSDSSAYALLTTGDGDSKFTERGQPTREVGTSGYISANQITFFKGPAWVSINIKGARRDSTALIDFARQLAATLDKGDGDIPVLVKHLPDWPNSEARSYYAVDLAILKQLTPNQPVTEAISFEGGTEAVTANYGPSQLVIVEFTTPQLAGDNDRRIIDKIHELWQQGKPSPTAYRRVGNYSVFVFNAPDEQTAKQLIDQVHYEQVVQWLGDNPHWLEAAQRKYMETTFGVFVNVVKGSGLALVLCFGVGGIFGALLFARRRTRQTATEAYSDAGGMTRLNLDELTAEVDASKLIGPGVPDKL